MPRLNNRGEYLQGIGGGGGRVHVLLGSDAYGNAADIGDHLRQLICERIGIPIGGEGSGWFWKDDDTIVGQFCGDPTDRNAQFGVTTGCTTWGYNIRTGALSGPFGPGANNGRGRGGSFGFWLGDTGYGVYTSGGYRNAVAGMSDVLGNGDVVIVKTYQQNELGIQVVRGQNIVRTIPTIGQVQGVTARGSVILWLDFGDSPPKLRADGAPNPIMIAGDYNHAGAFAVDRTGRLWILDSQNGLLLRAWDQPIGRWLSRDGYNFWGDVVSLGQTFRVVSSEHIGELPQTARVWDIDPITGNYTYNRPRPDSLTEGNAELINLETNAPATLTPPAQPVQIVNAATQGQDMIPIVIGVAALAAFWYYRENT